MNQTIRDIYLNHHYTYELKENIRFELAHGEDLDYHGRIVNARKRADVLFEEVFKDSESAQLIFFFSEDFAHNNISKLLYHNKFKIIDSFVTTSWNDYFDGMMTAFVIETPKNNLRIPKIIDAICYADFYEYGKLRLKSPFVFYNQQDNIILNIYDDRGCDIWTDDFSRGKEIYTNYNDWILDYDRDSIDRYYESVISDD